MEDLETMQQKTDVLGFLKKQFKGRCKREEIRFTPPEAFNEAEIDEQRTEASNDKKSKEQEYCRTFYKYLLNQEKQERLEDAFNSLETAVPPESPESTVYDSEGAKPNFKSGAAQRDQLKTITFFVVLPEELRSREGIQLGIIKFSGDCERLLNLKRLENDNGLFSGQCEVVPEKFWYIYVISLENWSVLEWLSDWQTPREWDPKDAQSAYIFDGSIVCNPDGDQNSVRLGGLLSMLPDILNQPSLASNEDIVKWVRAVCYQQLRLLERSGVTTRDIPLYQNYKEDLNRRWKELMSNDTPILTHRLYNTNFLCISTHNIQNGLRKLSPLFNVEGILLSLVLRLFSKKQILEMFSAENLSLPSQELIAIAVYNRPENRDEDSSSFTQLIQCLLEHIRPRLASVNDGREKLEMFIIARYLLHRLPKESIRPVVTLILLLMEDLDVRELKLKTAYKGESEHPLTTYLRTIPKQLPVTKHGATQEEEGKSMREEMLYWRELLTVTSDHLEVKSWWSKSLEENFEKRLRSLTVVILVKFVYCYEEIPVESIMGKIVLDVTFDRVFNVELRAQELEKLVPNVCNIINHGMNDEKMTDEVLIKKMVSWRNICEIYSFCESLNDEDQQAYMTPISRKNIKRCSSVIKKLLKDLDNRTITIDMFNNLLDNKDQFLRICNSKGIGGGGTETAMRMDLLSSEKSILSDFISKLEHFWGYHEQCIKEEKVKVVKWLDDAKIGRLIFKEVIHPESQENPLKWSSVICKVIPDDVEANLENFENFTTRSHYKDLMLPLSGAIYKEQVKKANPTKLADFPEVFGKAQSVYKDWKRKFKDGSITLGDLQVILKKYFYNQEESLLNEMKFMMKSNEALLGEREEQVKIGLHLEDYYEGAETILEMKIEFTPEGDYKEFANLFSEKYKETVGQIPIKSINDRLVKCSKLIKNISDDQKKFLSTFLESKGLTTWIAENVPASDQIGFNKLIKEMMTTGNDGTDENDRACCVVNALRGISPFIYDLQANSNYDEFLTCCERVWGKQNLKKLIMDIVNANESKCLSWLSTFKTRFQKSFDFDLCISEADLRQKAWTCYIGQTRNMTKLEDAFALKVGEENYNCQRITSLQNQLALVSRKKKDEAIIDFFFQFKDYLISCSELLLDLQLQACAPFDKIMIEITKNDKDIPTASIEIKLLQSSKNENALSLLRQETDDFKTFTGSTTKSPVQCLADWKDRWKSGMKRLRRQHPIVNYFTTRQIGVLRKELWEYQQKSWNADVLVKALDMLSLIHPVNANELKLLIEDAGGAQENENQIMQSANGGNKQQNPLIDSLLPQLSLNDLYILNYQTDGGNEGSQVCQLDLGCLNHILKGLEGRRCSLFHEAPRWLHPHKVSLIPVSKGNIYRMVISLYNYRDGYQILSNTRVLIITKDTTTEDVEIFTYRVRYESSVTFCMVNCHLLDHQKCKTIQKLLKEDIQKRGQLVCIYDSEVKDCGIAKCFKKNILSEFHLANDSDVTEFMEGALQKSSDGQKWGHIYDRYSAHWISSDRSGEGKSLYVRRMQQKFASFNHVVLPIDRVINMEKIVRRLGSLSRDRSNFIHFDISFDVHDGLDELLFNMLILGYLSDSEGNIWIKKNNDFFAIEYMLADTQTYSIHEVLKLFPESCRTTCISPAQLMERYKADKAKTCVDEIVKALADGCDKSVKSEECQRVLKYLHSLDTEDITFDKVREERHFEVDVALHLLIRYCGSNNPSWAELNNFIVLFNDQLRKLDESPNFMPGLVYAPEELRYFFVNLALQNAKVFPTSDETHGVPDKTEVVMKRNIDDHKQPKVFFSDDLENIYPFGFTLEQDGSKYYLVSKSERKELVPISKFYLEKTGFKKLDFDKIHKHELLKILRDIMVKKVRYVNKKGEIEDMFDPDDDPNRFYVLTMDNIEKILAIHQRLRVNSPVIIVGETGCGKTMLLNYMCELQILSDLRRANDKIKPMMTVKVHGGTTEQDLEKSVNEAVELSKRNDEICKEFAERKNSNQIPLIYTILFFDEANTTQHIGLIKEIICDRRMNGKPLESCPNLRIVAACNPYRRHNQKVIDKLCNAGLGYRNSEAANKFDEIPMRELVYHVKKLPPSLSRFLWKFEPISNKKDEGLYIEQMIKSRLGRKVEEAKLLEEMPLTDEIQDLLAEGLSESQEFMRGQEDECAFVSLRDVRRVFNVSSWFYKQKDNLYKQMSLTGVDDVSRSILLAFCACYLVKLEPDTRKAYVSHIKDVISRMCKGIKPEDSEKYMLEQFEQCQRLFMDGVVKSCKHLKEHIKLAENEALKENVFMMIVSIENRIPLFVIGKPGSSKSLAKTLVTDSMRGSTSDAEVFRGMKEIHTIPYLCSEYTTAKGIEDIFLRAQNIQGKKQDVDKFVSVVILDEVGLAEDTKEMPLKVLHPLLECYNSLEENKCAFIGISNWALDPAKMNRGIFVQRGDPSDMDLHLIAKMILEPAVANSTQLIESLIKGYKALHDKFKPESRKETEFYGLRDYYSLVKMVAQKTANGQPSKNMLEYCIRRNFGGFDKHTQIDAVKEFPLDHFPKDEQQFPDETAGLIKDCLIGEELESRYLLLLVESLSVLPLLHDGIYKAIGRPVEVIFGRMFSGDEPYEHAFNNISRIKDCIRFGKPVILMNISELYESLYDLLNQYFSRWDGKQFVDIGLGGERVNTPVHPNFRLIVVAEKETVYKEFPIPLISRLEKHYVPVSALLSTKVQRNAFSDLKTWAEKIVTCPNKQILKSNAFIGYSKENLALVVHTAAEHCKVDLQKNPDEKAETEMIFKRSKEILLWCVSGVALLNLSKTDYDATDQLEIKEIYKKRDQNSLSAILQTLKVEKEKGETTRFFQLTTHAPLLKKSHLPEIEESFNKLGQNIKIALLSMREITKEHNLTTQLRNFYKNEEDEERKHLLIIQCEEAHLHRELICSVQFLIKREFHGKASSSPCYTMLLLNVPQGASSICYQGREWLCAHIDHPQPVCAKFPSVQICQSLSPLEIFSYDGTNQQHSKEEKDVKFDITPLLSIWVTKTASQGKHQDETQNSNDSFIDIFCSLLENKESLKAFKKHMINIIYEWQKEGKGYSMKYSDKDWLSSAAFVESIREKIETYFEELFVPVVEELRTRVEYGGNFLILTKDSRFCKKKTKDMWTCLFQKVNLHKSKIEIQQGSEMQLKFPFSWLVKQHLEILTFTVEEEAAHKAEGAIKEVELRFGRTDLGKTILQHSKELKSHKKEKFLMAYLKDFLIFSHPHLSKKERKVFRRLLKKSSNCKTFPAIHKLYYENVERLQALSQLCRLDSEACDNLRETDLSGLEADMLAYLLMKVEKIPQDVWINDVKGCLETYHKFQPLINNLFRTQKESEILDKKDVWLNLQVRRLFAESFILHDENNSFAQLAEEGLSSVPKFHHGEFDTKDSFEEILKFLENILEQGESRGKTVMKEDLQKRVMKFLVNYMTNFVSGSSVQIHSVIRWIQSNGSQCRMGHVTRKFFKNPMARPFLHQFFNNHSSMEYEAILNCLTRETVNPLQEFELNRTEIEKTAPTLAAVINYQKTLSAAKYLPDLVQLLKSVCDKLKFHISRIATSNVSINQFVTKFNHIAPELEDLFESCFAAWNMVKTNEQNKKLDSAHAVSELFNRTLPENRRNALSSLIEEISQVSKQYCLSRDVEEDIYKLVLPHCYLDDNHEVRFDWLAIEHDSRTTVKNSALEEGFIPDKLPSLDITEDSKVLQKLMSLTNMVQEELSDAEQKAILIGLAEFDMNDITVIANNLKVILELLADDSSVDSSVPLKTFLVQSLGIEFEFLSNSVLLKNIQSVWLLLKYQEASYLNESDEIFFAEPYEGFLEKFKNDKEQLLKSFQKKTTAKPDIPTQQSCNYDFEIIKCHLKKLCDETGAKNVYAINRNRFSKCIVIGQNVSLLEKSIKEHVDLKKFDIIVKEHQGRVQQPLLSGYVIKHQYEFFVRCELFLKGTLEDQSEEEFSFFPAHLIVPEKYFGETKKLEEFRKKDIQISFQHNPDNLLKVEEFIFEKRQHEESRQIIDIAAVKVTNHKELLQSESNERQPRILQVTQEFLKHMKERSAEVYLKNKDITGHVSELLAITDNTPDEDGLLWIYFDIPFDEEVFAEGDCGTIIYVKDNQGSTYMLSMLRTDFRTLGEHIYGTVILSSNVIELSKTLRLQKLLGLEGEQILNECSISDFC